MKRIFTKFKLRATMFNKHKSEKSEVEETKLIQKGGDNSSQTQIGRVDSFVVCGITEKRVREIYNELSPQTLAQHTRDAHDLMIARIEILEEKIMQKAETVSDLIPAFADPYFQTLLISAQQSAATTEREDDYALLSELLACHVKNGKTRNDRVAIKKALGVISEVEIDALHALTLASVVMRCTPTMEHLMPDLVTFSAMFKLLMNTTPPSGREWLEHLEMLGAVRITPATSLAKFHKLYPAIFDGYVCIGIKEDSEEYNKAKALLESINWSPKFLVKNELLDGYYRLDLRSRSHIKNRIISNGEEQREINAEEIRVLEEIWDMYQKDIYLYRDIADAFMKRWDSFEPLKNLRIWWDAIPCGFEITPVGRILAYVNSKCCYIEIPELL